MISNLQSFKPAAIDLPEVTDKALFIVVVNHFSISKENDRIDYNMN